MRFRTIAVAVGAGVLATGTVGYVAAQADETGDTGPPPPPGTPHVDEPPSRDAGPEPGSAGDFAFDEDIQTGSSTYEPQTLTKFIPGTEFDALQASGLNADLVAGASGGDVCVSPNTGSGGTLTEWRAGIELPDGAKLTKVIAYGEDNDAAEDISFQVAQTTYNLPIGLAPPAPPPTPTRSDTIVDTFTTSGASGLFALSGADLDVVTGSKAPGGGPILITSTDHQFFDIRVLAINSAGTNHVLCGVEVLYQVPTAADPGTVFHPLENPIRAYDGRIGAIPQSGRMLPNSSKVISVKDGYDSAGAVSDANVVPTSATAVAYNITIAAPDNDNFMSVTPGDAASFTASAINYQAGSNVANAGSVGIDDSRQIKVWNGDKTGSAFAIIDITGWYGPPTFPNMGN
jgi:hypothetical protein